MREYRLSIAPGQTEEIAVEGQYFRIHDASVLVTVETRPSDRKSAAIVTLSEGNDVKTAPFKALRIRHDNGAVQVIVLYVSDIGEIRSSAIAGTVTIDNVNGGFSQGRDNVTNVAETIIAANANRRYLGIQNNDAAQVLRITLDGDVPTATAGFRIQPGEFFEVPGFCCTGAVQAIMEGATATANNVEWVEG